MEGRSRPRAQHDTHLLWALTFRVGVTSVLNVVSVSDAEPLHRKSS